MAFEKHHWLLERVAQTPGAVVATEATGTSRLLLPTGHSTEVSLTVVNRLVRAGLLDEVPQTFDPTRQVWHITGDGLAAIGADRATALDALRAEAARTWRNDARMSGWSILIDSGLRSYTLAEIGAALSSARPFIGERRAASSIASQGAVAASEVLCRSSWRALRTLSSVAAKDGVVFARCGLYVDEFGDMSDVTVWEPELADLGLSGLRLPNGADLGLAGTEERRRHVDVMAGWLVHQCTQISSSNPEGLPRGLRALRAASEAVAEIRGLARTLAEAPSDAVAAEANLRVHAIGETLKARLFHGFVLECSEAVRIADGLDDVRRIGARLSTWAERAAPQLAQALAQAAPQSRLEPAAPAPR